MIILKWIYKILFYLLTSFHNLYLTISGVVDRFNDAFSWSRPTVKTGASYSETFLMEDVGNKLRKQSKLPKHLACVFNEPVVNLDCVVSIIRWCAAAGIGCISLYDHEGESLLHLLSCCFNFFKLSTLFQRSHCEEC